MRPVRWIDGPLPGYHVAMTHRCSKTIRTCRNLLCPQHGLGVLAKKRYVGLRRPGETDEETQRRLYEETMARERAQAPV